MNYRVQFDRENNVYVNGLHVGTCNRSVTWKGSRADGSPIRQRRWAFHALDGRVEFSGRRIDFKVIAPQAYEREIARLNRSRKTSP